MRRVADVVRIRRRAAVIIGVLPGLQATNPRLHSGVRIADGLRFGRHWTVLIVAQVAFAVALLPPSVRGAWRSLQDGLAGPGFAAHEYLSAHLGADTPLAQGRFGLLHAELLRRLEADPRVTQATWSLAEPGDEPGARIEPRVRPASSTPSATTSSRRASSPPSPSPSTPAATSPPPTSPPPQRTTNHSSKAPSSSIKPSLSDSSQATPSAAASATSPRTRTPPNGTRSSASLPTSPPASAPTGRTAT